MMRSPGTSCALLAAFHAPLPHAFYFTTRTSSTTPASFALLPGVFHSPHRKNTRTSSHWAPAFVRLCSAHAPLSLAFHSMQEDQLPLGACICEALLSPCPSPLSISLNGTPLNRNSRLHFTYRRRTTSSHWAPASVRLCSTHAPCPCAFHLMVIGTATQSK